jgi:hypothetical protein
MQAAEVRRERGGWFWLLLAGVGAVWALLALLGWLFPSAARVLLTVPAGVALLAGFGWYCAARWAGGRGPADPGALRRPAVLLGFAWLLCLGSALASVVVPRGGNDVPTTPGSAAGAPGQEGPAAAGPAWVPTKLFPTGPCRYLSDLPEFDVKIGKVAFGKNGAVGDGKRIVVCGVPSPKGLGMAPPWAPAYSAVKYRLGKEAAVFRAVVAVNDTTNWCWSPATFTVLGNGIELWKSSMPISCMDANRSQACRVEVTGVDVLELRVQCVNGSNGVEAVWVEPRVLAKADAPDPAVPSADGLFAQGPRRFLADLRAFDWTAGPWPVATDGTVGNPEKTLIQVGGMRAPRGLGMRPPRPPGYAAVKYRLGKRAAVFKAAVALNDAPHTPALNLALFEVLGDRNVLWRSPPVGTPGRLLECRVDVSGVDVLELRVRAPDEHVAAPAVWIEPRVLQRADTPDE